MRRQALEARIDEIEQQVPDPETRDPKSRPDILLMDALRDRIDEGRSSRSRTSATSDSIGHIAHPKHETRNPERRKARGLQPSPGTS